MTSQNIIMIVWVMNEFRLCIWISEPCKLILLHVVFRIRDKIQRDAAENFEKSDMIIII